MEMQFTYGKIVADEKPDPARPQSKSKPKSSASSGKPSDASPRIHHKTTTLTTDRYTYAMVMNLQPGKVYPVQAVNDIVSSCVPGSKEIHQMRRRSRLVRSQVNGGFKKIKVRSDSANAIECVLHGIGSEPDDACQFTVYVMRHSA